MTAYSDRRDEKKPSGRLTLILLGFFFLACVIGALYVGDLTKLQEPALVEQSQTAMRDVDDAAALDQVLKRYPANRMLRLVALARKDAADFDAEARKLLSDAEPAAVAQLIDLAAASRADLDALRASLKTAETNAAAFKPRLDALTRTKRDAVEKDARALGAGGDTLTKFMAVIDAQRADIAALVTKVAAARAERIAAYDKCAAILIKESGSYTTTKGRIIFRTQPVADSYNAAGTAMAAAAKRIGDLDAEGAALRQSQLKRWKDFVG